MVRYVSVSEMQDFLNDRWRWYARWILNRVPRKWSEALELGTAVHDIFEDFFTNGPSMETSFDKVYAALGVGIVDPDHAFVVAKAKKALLSYKPQIVAYRDRFHIDRTLEVEVPFDLPLLPPTETHGEWRLRGRPDRVLQMEGGVYHMQHKTVAGNKDVGMYAQLIGRSMHEGCYGYYLANKYPMRYGGTVLNIVRKAVAGPKHPIEGLMHQTLVTVDRTTRMRSFAKAARIASEMLQCGAEAQACGHNYMIDNTYHDDGFFHNSLDGYFDVLRGKASLDDDSLFMKREETY